MDQIYMLEIFVDKLTIEIANPDLTEDEVNQKQLKALEKKRNQKQSEKKKCKKRSKPSDEEQQMMDECLVNISCKNLFNFALSPSAFRAPPENPHYEFPPTAKPCSASSGASRAKRREKKTKKKAATSVESKTSQETFEPPDYGYGESAMFSSRPHRLIEVMKANPIEIEVMQKNKDNCIGRSVVKWDETFYTTIRRSGEVYPLALKGLTHKLTTKPEIISNTLEMKKNLQCEDSLRLSGHLTIYVRLTCLGDRVVSTFVAIPEPERQNKFIMTDVSPDKNIELSRKRGTEDEAVPIAPLYESADIADRTQAESLEAPPVITTRQADDYKAPFSSRELIILSMGFPKGPCGGTNCLDRLRNKPDEHVFVPGYYDGKDYIRGGFVNVADVHGPCGKLECPLAKKIRHYLATEGAYKPCKKPCNKDYY